MAKNITFFDKEHTGGINLAAMEDTQLKENLVQDVAAGGDEAPTTTAVKEAVDAKLDKADIIDDLTTGGANKALSAEQGKVLDEKKVDKLTEATDLVYVHGADGTEQGKALAEFVVDTDIVNDRVTGGTDKVLSAEQGKVLDGKKVDKLTEATDLVYVHEAGGTESGKALSEFVVDTDIVNDLTTGGTDKVLSAEQGKVLDGKKVDKLTEATDLVYVHGADGTESGKALAEFVVDTDIVNDRVTGGVDKVLAAEVGKDIPASFELNFTAANYPLTAATIDKDKYTDHVMAISSLYIHPDEIPADIKSKIKKGDIISTVVASPIMSCKAIFAKIADATESSTNVTSDVVNTSLPAAGNWEGWYEFQVIISEQDKLIVNGKTNTYITYLFDGDETLDTLPDANGPMPTGGFSYSLVFIKPSDIKANRYTSVPSPYFKQVDGSTIKPGDILVIETPTTAEATKKVKAIHCLISHTAAATNSRLDTAVHNTKLPAAGNWGGWLVGRILSSGWDREVLLSKTDSTKMQSYFVELPVEGKTFASMPDLINFNSDKCVLQSNLFVHPDDITDISSSLKKGDTVLFLGKNSPTGKAMGPVTAIYAGYINDGAIPNDDITLNVTDPDGGNFAGWHAFTAVSSAYGRVQIENKTQSWTINVKATDQQFKDTLTISKVGNIEDKACPMFNFMLTKDMMAQIPNAKPGDSLYVHAQTVETGLPWDIHLYGKLHSLIATSTPPYWYAIQDNSGDISGCGSMRVESSNFLNMIVTRKPNFWTMDTSTGGSDIPSGLRSLETIAFAPSDDTANFAGALKEGDIIEVRNVSDVMYTLMFIRYATSADNNFNKNMIVGQATEPADMTGYLWCRIISSRYDTNGTIIYRTNKYQPNQFEIGKSYRMRITVSEATDQLELYELGIDSGNLDLYNCVLRRGFKIGEVFNLLLENGTKSVMLLVTLGFNNVDNSIHALCLASGDNQVAGDLG